MSDKYERLQALTVKKEIKQGVFVYVPFATFDKAGIIQPFSEHFEFDNNSGKPILKIHGDILQLIDDSLINIKDILEGDLVVGRALADQDGRVIDEHYATKTELANEVDELDSEIVKIVNGTTLVDKALKDDLGNTIKSTYANKLDLVYSSSNNRIAITLKSYDGASIDADLLTLPKASDTKDGLLDKDDKVKLDNLAGNAETTYIKNDTKGVAGGVVPLDNNTKIALTYLYDGVLGQLEYVGTFDGVTLPSMTQNLSPNRAVRKGDYFIAIGSGIINSVDFEIGDWLIFNSPSTWAKIDNTDAVSLVNNKKGVVVLDGTDINWADDENKTIKAKISEIDIELADIYRKDQVYTKNEIDNLLDQLIEVTWQELKDKRDAGLLTPGQQYRITDYITTTVQENTQSAGHPFDLIVVADSVNKLNEQARAIQHAGDTYFANSKLEAWQVWYSLDNDTNRFAWADEENGKGVIYRMIDEFNNDCPYDFKNIKFLRDGFYYYTFTAFENTDETIKDASIMREMAADDMVEGMTYNSMKPYYIYADDFVYPQSLNFNIFKSYYDDGDTFYMPANNHFGLNCYNNFFDDTEFTRNNTFGNYVSDNSFGNNVKYNSFGNSVYSNTFGNYVSDNSFGNSVSGNSFGNGVNYNTFGNYVSGNSFGNGVSNNTFGSSVQNNSFGNSVSNNSFGNSVSNNSFGNNVDNNTFGSSVYNNTFGNNFMYNTVKNSVGYVRTPDSTYPNYFQYVTLENGLSGASSANTLNLDGIQAVVGYNTPIKVARGTGTEIVAVWQDKAGDTNGKYKNNNLDNVWKTIPQEIEGGSF